MTTETEQASEISLDEDDASYDAAWDAATAEEEDGSDDPDETEAEEEDGEGSDLGGEDGEGDEGEDGEDDEGEGDEEEGEEAAESDDEPAPSWLPRGLKENWGKVPKDLRGEIATSYQHLGERLGEQGRMIQGLTPIKDELVSLAREIPALQAMTPDQVVGNMRELALINQRFDDDPVRAIFELVDRYQVGPHIQRIIAGQVDPETANRLADQAKQERQQQNQQRQFSPEAMKTHFQEWQAETKTREGVVDFASRAEHWEQVEGYLLSAIPMVKDMKGPNASEMDVLTAAYELVCNQLGLSSPDQKPAKAAAPRPDPERAEKASKAKSVNVTSNLTGRKRTLSEDEVMSRAYDRAMRRS